MISTPKSRSSGTVYAEHHHVHVHERTRASCLNVPRNVFSAPRKTALLSRFWRNLDGHVPRASTGQNSTSGATRCVRLYVFVYIRLTSVFRNRVSCFACQRMIVSDRPFYGCYCCLYTVTYTVLDSVRCARDSPSQVVPMSKTLHCRLQLVVAFTGP